MVGAANKPKYSATLLESSVMVVSDEPSDRRARDEAALAARELNLYAGVMCGFEEVRRGEFVYLDDALVELEKHSGLRL